MALKLKITNRKGITTNYHRISALEVTDRIVVTLASYVSKDYRDSEKKIQENLRLKEELEKQIIDEQVKEDPDMLKIMELQARVNSLDLVPKENVASSMRYTVPFDVEDDISFKSIYEQLKQEEVFKDAEDC